MQHRALQKTVLLNQWKVHCVLWLGKKKRSWDRQPGGIISPVEKSNKGNQLLMLWMHFHLCLFTKHINIRLSTIK